MADEDERWLYGDSAQEESENPGKKEPEPVEKEEPAPAEPEKHEEEGEEEKSPEKEVEEKKEEAVEETADAPEVKAPENKENGEIAEEEEGGEEEDEDEDDSDDDNVHVIIGDINKSGPTYTNINISKRGPTITGPGVKSTGKFSMEDFESVGIINGVPAHEFNVDVLEDKPWRIPGADITDYFNYGFNEDTWKAYCERQKRIRIHESCTGLPIQTQTGQSWQNSQGGQTNQYSNSQPSGGKKAGWETGQIRVIGSGVASRRIDESGPDNQNIQVIPSSNNFSGIPPPNMMPSLIPPMEIPPPGFPASADPYGAQPSSTEYFNPEPDYFSSYEPTAADQWRDGWAPGNLVTFGQNVKPVHSHLEDNNSQDRSTKEREKERERERERERDRDRDAERDRDRDIDRDEKDKRKDRSHRRSRSKSHERKRNKSRSRSPSHKKHKKKSKKSDRKKRSDDNE